MSSQSNHPSGIPTLADAHAPARDDQAAAPAHDSTNSEEEAAESTHTARAKLPPLHLPHSGSLKQLAEQQLQRRLTATPSPLTQQGQHCEASSASRSSSFSFRSLVFESPSSQPAQSPRSSDSPPTRHLASVSHSSAARRALSFSPASLALLHSEYSVSDLSPALLLARVFDSMADQPPASTAAEGQSSERNVNGNGGSNSSSNGNNTPTAAAPSNGVLPGSSSPFSSRSTSSNSPASSPRKPPQSQQQQSDISSRRGSLSSLHRDPSKPVKPTSSFPVPQQPDPPAPASPARLRSSLRSPRETPAGGAFGSPNAAAAAAAASAATTVPVPAAQSNAGEGLWPLSSSAEGSSAQSMLPPSAINAAASAAGSGSPPLPCSSSQQGFSMPLTSRLSPAASVSAIVPPLPPASLAHTGGFGSFLQHQHAQAAYAQQLMLAQQQQQQQQQQQGYPDSARQLFASVPAQTHAMQSVYLQRLHEEVMDPQQRFLQQQQWQQQAEFEQQQAQQQQQQRRQAPAHVLIPRPSYASAAAAAAYPSASPPLLPGAAVSASPLVYHNHVQAGSRESLPEADDDGDEGAGEEEGEDSEGGYAIPPGTGRGRRGRGQRGSSSSDGDGSPSEQRERIGVMAGVAAAAAAPTAGSGSSQHLRVGFALGSDSAEDLPQQAFQSESTNAGLMRKAQSAADFKSFSSARRTAGGGGSGRSKGADLDLGVLTPFYSSETGTFVATAAAAAAGASGSQPHSGSLGASANASSSSLSTLRSSISHAVLSSAAGAAATRGASSSRASNTAPGAPLVAHFSLGGGSKYNGQIRGQRRELAMVTEKLREMSYEVSRLHRKIKEYDEEREQWSLRYGRRAVILSNLMLGGWIFLLQLMEGIKAKRIRDSWVNRLFIPSSVFNAAANAAAAAAGGGVGSSAATAAAAAALAKQTGVSLSMATSIATAAGAAASGAAGSALSAAAGSAAGGAASSAAAPLSAVLISGFLTGVQSSLWFLISAALQMKTQSWKRNTGFALSAGYSLFLILFRRGQFRPASANVVNILANLVYIAARYYFLHGLLVFNSMRIL